MLEATSCEELLKVLEWLGEDLELRVTPNIQAPSWEKPKQLQRAELGPVGTNHKEVDTREMESEGPLRVQGDRRGPGEGREEGRKEGEGWSGRGKQGPPGCP